MKKQEKLSWYEYHPKLKSEKIKLRMISGPELKQKDYATHDFQENFSNVNFYNSNLALTNITVKKKDKLMCACFPRRIEKLAISI